MSYLFISNFELTFFYANANLQANSNLFSRNCSENASEVEIIEDEDQPDLENRNPWPQLEKFYCLKSRAVQNLKYECVLCRPKKVLISTGATSHSNLRKHVKVSYLGRNFFPQLYAHKLCL